MKCTSHLFTTMRGSVGGITYLAGRAAGIIGRQRRVPTNPNTELQNQIKSQFSTAVQEWNSLTDTERNRWGTWASGLTISKPTGPYTPSGREMFIGCYTLARYAFASGLTVTPGTSAPLTPGWLTVSNLSMNQAPASGIGFKVACTNFHDEAYTVIVEVSYPQNVSKNYYAGPWDTSKTSEITLSAGPVSGQVDFTDLIADMKYFVRVRCISASAPHRISNEFIISGIAQEVV